MFAALLAATMTFTATSTGVEKGTSIEFVFAGKGTDRDYETMFVLDEPVDDFCQRLESSGLPRGRSTDKQKGFLWPVGCQLSFDPPLGTFLDGKLPDGVHPLAVYTGGSRLSDGSCDASTNMPLSVFSIYTLDQSPIVFDGIFNQGDVYGCFTAKTKLEKGSRVNFTVSWVETSMPRHIHLTAKSGNLRELIENLRHDSTSHDLDVLVGFDETMTLREARAFAQALSEIDSRHVKINGCSNIFYRSFLPLVKWRDRKERLVQPFELTLGSPDRLVHIDEDWTVEGIDPKLSERPISFDEISNYSRTDTCFVFASEKDTLHRVLQSMSQLKSGRITNWYVFCEE